MRADVHGPVLGPSSPAHATFRGDAGGRRERPWEEPPDEDPRRGTGEFAAVEEEPERRTEPRERPEVSESQGNVASLVIQTSFIGDLVLTTPLIAELATRGPVDVVVTPASAPLLANNPSVRRRIVYDKRGDERGLTGLWRVSRTLLEGSRTDAAMADAPRGGTEIGAAYLAQGSIRSAMLAVLAGITERVGFDTSAGRALYTRRVAWREDLHHAERLWQLAARGSDMRADPAQIRPRLFPGEQEVDSVNRLLGADGDSGAPLVALAPGSVWATKRWPHYADLARRLAPRARIALVGGPGDVAEADAIEAAMAPARPIHAVGKLGLLASAELIGRAAVLVTNDSAPQHLASAMGTPTVAIFGPTVPEFGFGPLARESATAGHEALACRPCDRHGPRRCPLVHWRCMRELAPERIEALVQRISSTPMT